MGPKNSANNCDLYFYIFIGVCLSMVFRLFFLVILLTLY
ncbi:Uncharacterised protein [Escherichia coli]|nr:Uncharacterised protein [Escherichia coli]